MPLVSGFAPALGWGHCYKLTDSHRRKAGTDIVDNLTGGERATGTPNTIYDLSSVLFHALEGGASYDTYIEDAEREGDQELADFFRRVRDEDSMRADEAQVLLAERTPSTTTATTTSPTVVEPVEGATAPTEGLATGAPRREETTGRMEAPPPRTTGIEEGTLPRREEAVTGDIPPGTEETAAPPPGRESASRQPERDREEDKGLIDRAKDAIVGEEEEEPSRRGEGTDRLDRR